MNRLSLGRKYGPGSNEAESNWFSDLLIVALPCPGCGGTGTYLPDDRIGEALRRRREARDISLRSMAKKIGISAPYLSDLERGNRHWNQKYINYYR